jgi:hypothetical protein
MVARSSRSLLLFLPVLLSLLLLPACGTVRDWREMRTDPMPLGEAYEGLQYIVTRNGFTVDAAASDRGNGLLQSRWRDRLFGNRHRGRFRLQAEVLIDEGSAANGWPLRYILEQQEVKDSRHFTDPREEDWSPSGQDSEGEAILGEQLLRKLAPKSLVPSKPPPKSDAPTFVPPNSDRRISEPREAVRNGP